MPEQISLHEARETARLTLPKSPPRNTGHTLAEAAYLHLSQHAQAVAARTGVSADERDLLAEKILRDLSDDAVRKFGFPVMTKAAIRWLHDIIGNRNALEVGAGPALISAELQAIGSRIRATDPQPPSSASNNRYGFTQALTKVEPLDALSAIRRHAPDVLVWSWPEMHPHTNEALDAFAGSDVVYIGESDFGCTGTSEFHEILNERFTARESFSIPQYPFRHDRCHHFTRHASR